MSETEEPAGTGQPEDQEQEQELPLPPASFQWLAISLATQAEVHLGLMRFGEEKAEPNFKLARHSIDLLGVLQEKTMGNLTMEEQRYLENTLTELRFRYVQKMEESRKPQA